MPYITMAVVNETSETPPPTSPVGTPQAWYDAEDTGSITTVSDAVSQWNDQMGSFNLTQGTAGDRPLYGGGAARTINGITVVEWVSSDFLTSSCPRDDRTSTAFVVGLSDSTAANRTMLGGSGGDGADQFRVDTGGALTTNVEGVGAVGTQANAEMVTALAFIGVQLLTATSVQHFLYQSGLSATETDSNSSSFTAGRTLKLGLRSNGTEPWDGLMGEIIIYNSTLSSDDVLLNVAYLKNKWGIADVA